MLDNFLSWFLQVFILVKNDYMIVLVSDIFGIKNYVPTVVDLLVFNILIWLLISIVFNFIYRAFRVFYRFIFG